VAFSKRSASLQHPAWPHLPPQLLSEQRPSVSLNFFLDLRGERLVILWRAAAALHVHDHLGRIHKGRRGPFPSRRVSRSLRDSSEALKELIDKKAKGVKIAPRPERAPAPVIDLMEALRRSVTAEPQPKTAAPVKRGKKKIPGQKEMLLPISGKKQTTAEQTSKAGKPASRQRKAG
jgi:hypothetical protein